jgi:hypothetical protein
MAKRDQSLDALLDLDGQTLVIDDEGHLVRFAVRQTDITEVRPHGLSYSLSLHDRTGRRLMGFDNAHRVQHRGGKFAEQPRVYDHVHRGKDDEGRPYRFQNPGKLLEDFWAEVDRILDLDEE